MRHVQQVPIAPRDPACFSELVASEHWSSLRGVVRASARALGGRTVWNVNSTATGGGVAEMLRSLVAYARGAGADVRWVVISPAAGIEGFFAVTKRIHNMLHGHCGDGLGLGREDREIYRAALEPSAIELRALVRPDDVVILHDPQTAGLVPALRGAGVHVVWRCHVGADDPNGQARAVWDFLRPLVEQADRYVFSRAAHVWDGLALGRTLIVPPSIDAFSPKNQDLARREVDAILSTCGVVAGTPSHMPTFRRQDGSIGHVARAAQMLGTGAIDPSAPLVTQVSRWDGLKDPLGVMEGFFRHVLPALPHAQLALVGPDPAAVADDPEGARVLRDCRDAWRACPANARARIALVCLPMTDLEENAVMVNAIQRHSTVIVQKSLAEGFGLTVAEAMWKSRPVIASRVGGIVDQIVDGDSGVLVGDPTDSREFGDAVSTLLTDPATAARMGRRARDRIADRFLATRSLVQYARALATLGPDAAEPLAA